MKYHGPVWGELPDEYPQVLAETTYRFFLSHTDRSDDELKHKWRLAGAGFNGVAWRWMGAKNSNESYSNIIDKHGLASGSNIKMLQEIQLFSFFTSIVSAIDCYTFSIYVMGSTIDDEKFPTDSESLKKIDANNTLQKYHSCSLSDLPTIKKLSDLVKSDTFSEIKDIRNVLTHRAVPLGKVVVNIGSSDNSGDVEEYWQPNLLGIEGLDDLKVPHVTDKYWEWIKTATRELWIDLWRSRWVYVNLKRII